jgi:hypothetical protein
MPNLAANERYWAVIFLLLANPYIFFMATTLDGYAFF